jgi:hypothetical protein
MIRERPQQGDRYDVMIIPASSLDAKRLEVGSIDLMNKKGRTTPENGDSKV